MANEQTKKQETVSVSIAAEEVSSEISSPAEAPASFEWRAPEFRFYEKSSRWFVVSAVVAALLIILALIQGNFLFGVFVVIAELLILFWAKTKPREVTIKISPEGLMLPNGSVRPWASLLGFALMENLGGPEYFELIVRHAEPISFYTRILVPNEDAEEVKSILEQYVPAMEYQETMVEHLTRWMGF